MQILKPSSSPKQGSGFQAKRVIDSWIGFYDAERPRTALEKQTPDDACFDAVQINQAA